MIIGTAGHIDHGKTSLVKAITGVDADRLKEEKARGITIDLGFAYWPQADGGVIGFVDVPGHERFVHTMMAGAQGVDLVLLVIAADDGIMPQTREHLEILALMGVSRLMVALTKIDAVSPERRIEAENAIALWLMETPFAGADIWPVSSRTGEGLQALMTALQAAAGERAARSEARGFRLAVDRSFILQGAGVVVTGTVLDGRVNEGDEVILSPSGLKARVRSIRRQNTPSGFAYAGDRCALNLAGAGVTKEAITRGDMVLAPFLHAPSARIDAQVTVAAGAAKGLTQWMPVRLHHGTAECGAHLVLLTDTSPMPGEVARVQIVPERPLAALVGDRFILRDPSARFTLAGGVFLDLRAPERKRRTPERMAILDALAGADLAMRFSALLAASEAPVELTSFSRDHGVTPEAGRALAEAAGGNLFLVQGQVFALCATRRQALAVGMAATLARFHEANPDLPGMGLERLRLQAAPRIPAALFRAMVQAEVAAGQLAMEGSWIRLASHSIALSLEDENLWFEVRPRLGGAERFRPPRVRDIGNAMQEDEAVIRRLLKRVGRAGAVDEVAQDHFFLRETVHEVANLAAALEVDQNGWFNAAAFRDRVEATGAGSIGRKVAIQVLEFFDRHGFTIRRGDLRRVNPHRRDLFALPAGDAERQGRESSPVGRPDFKSGWGREPVPGGFDSHSLPPNSAASARQS